MHTNKIIQINNQKVEIHDSIITGLELKNSGKIPEEVTLFKHIPHEVDEVILNHNSYEIESGMKFFSEGYHKDIKILIDSKEFILEKENYTGIELKLLATIPLENKLLKDEKNGGSDTIIEDTITYSISSGYEYFSVPQGIQNGGIL